MWYNSQPQPFSRQFPLPFHVSVYGNILQKEAEVILFDIF